jgi:hypothetical protein
MFVCVEKTPNVEAVTDVRNPLNPFIGVRLVAGMRLQFDMCLSGVFVDSFSINPRPGKGSAPTSLAFSNKF